MKTEKQTRKEREVIARGEIQQLANNNHKSIAIDDGPLWALPEGGKDLPPKTKIEIVAVLPAEPERRVAMPKGARWITSKVFPRLSALVVNDVEVAAVDDNEVKGFEWSIKKDIWRNAETLELAQRAVGEALATAGLDGFRWKEVEPEYWFYTVLCGIPGKSLLPSPDEWRPIKRKHDAQKEFDVCCECSCSEVRLLGFTIGSSGNFQMAELDRHEASDK